MRHQSRDSVVMIRFDNVHYLSICRHICSMRIQFISSYVRILELGIPLVYGSVG